MSHFMIDNNLLKMNILRYVISLIVLFGSIAALRDEDTPVDDNAEQNVYMNHEQSKRDILTDSSLGRSGLKNTSLRWPNGIVPYVIEGSYNTTEWDMIITAMNEIRIKTCIRFIPQTDEEGYIAILNIQTKGCKSITGYYGVRQELYLESGVCFTDVGDVSHELLHTLGFYHEIQRPDRDNYVTVNYTNIRTDADPFDFKKLNETLINDFGVPFDYDSVMLYNENAASGNGLPTVISHKNVTIGQRKKLSDGDVLKINRMYNCTCLPNTCCQRQPSAQASNSSISGSM